MSGMSNWRPHGLFNVAHCDLFKLNYHLKLKVIHKIWLIFVNFAIKLAKICLKLTQRVICNSKLQPAVSFSSFTTQCAARTVIWVWHACFMSWKLKLGLQNGDHYRQVVVSSGLTVFLTIEILHITISPFTFSKNKLSYCQLQTLFPLIYSLPNTHTHIHTHIYGQYVIIMVLLRFNNNFWYEKHMSFFKLLNCQVNINSDNYILFFLFEAFTF